MEAISNKRYNMAEIIAISRQIGYKIEEKVF